MPDTTTPSLGRIVTWLTEANWPKAVWTWPILPKGWFGSPLGWYRARANLALGLPLASVVTLSPPA